MAGKALASLALGKSHLAKPRRAVFAAQTEVALPYNRGH
jgi:hypothetical protein